MQDIKNIHGIYLIEKNGRQIISNLSKKFLKNKTERQHFQHLLFEFLKDSLWQSKETQIFLYGEHTVLVKCYADFAVLVLASEEENEIFLKKIMQAIDSSLTTFVGKEIKLENIFQYISQVTLILDEIYSNGVVLTLSPEEICSRVMMKENKYKPRKIFMK